MVKKLRNDMSNIAMKLVNRGVNKRFLDRFIGMDEKRKKNF